MSIQDLLAAANEQIRRKANDQGILTLGALRAALSMAPADAPVVIDNGEVPASLASYRGYYERLAIGTKRHRDDYRTEIHRYHASDFYQPGASDVTIAEPVTATEVIKALDIANGEDFEGYKGGQFDMHSGTFLHVAEYGDCGREVVGAHLDGDRVVIETAEEEW